MLVLPNVALCNQRGNALWLMTLLFSLLFLQFGFFCGEGVAYKKVSFMVIAAYIPFYFVIFISFVLFITVECVCVC